MRTTSPRHVVALSTAAAALLVLTACGREDSGAGVDPESTASDTASQSSTPPEASQSSPGAGETSQEPASGEPTAVRFLGTGPRGPVLYTETVLPDGDSPLDVLDTLTRTPTDPDYGTYWVPGSFTSAEISDGVATVGIAPEAVDAPAGASEATLKASLQQVAWTLKSTADAGTVHFTLDGDPATTVLGVQVPDGKVKAGGAMKWLTKMQIDSPTEGQEVPARFTATGTNNGFEAWVGWQLLKDGTSVKDGFGTAEGWMDKNYPWRVDIDLSGVPAGTYTLRFHNEDASDGEGVAPDEDTKTITLK